MPDSIDDLTREALSALQPEPGKHPLAHLQRPGLPRLPEVNEAALREYLAELRGRHSILFEQAVEKVIAVCRDAAIHPEKFDAIIETHFGKGH